MITSVAAATDDAAAWRVALVDHGQRAAVRAGAPGSRHAWTALSGFVAVAAVAFFAIWLSNLLCAVLIFTVGSAAPVSRGAGRHHRQTGDQGRVTAINLLFTTLVELPETGGALVQVPNSQFFQKSVRRWRGTDVLPLVGEDKSVGN